MAMEDNFYSRLYNKFVSGRLNKYYYFMWMNKLNNTKIDFSILSEEEFVNKYLKESSSKLNGLKMWESTQEYQGLMQELYEFKMNQDFYKLYETYLAKAMNGDDKALNSLKTIKKEIESLNKPKTNKAKVEDEQKFDME